MKSEHKKLILALGLLAVAGGVYFFLGRSKGPLPDTVTFVCVATGETFDLDRDEIPSVFPVKNPKTGQRTLVPATRDADGKLAANPRFAHDLLRDPQLAEVNKYVDPNTLEILKSPR